MKPITLLLLVVLASMQLPAQERVSFNVQYSPLYATYDFVGKLSDNYLDNELKTIFNQSAYATDTHKKQIAEFERLQLDYTYPFSQYPSPLKVGLMSRDLLERNLATSQTLSEFKSKSMGLIPNETLSSFAGILENFLPIYQKLIFEPNKAAFDVQKNNLMGYVNSNQFADYFQMGLDFYHTAWDKQVPFEICLLPSLDKGNLGARAFVNVAVCEASLGLKDHQALFSVAMHEIYHIVYDNQSLALKNQVQQWFNHTPSVNSQYALLLMNEVLATALGNAYVTEQLKGKIGEDDWYDNKYIAAMAQAIYPTVKAYLAAKKPIDEAFVNTYVSLYDSQFAHWNKELNHLFAYRYILTDQEADLRYLRRTYRKYSYSRLGSPISLAEIEKMKALPITKVFVVSEKHQATLNLIKNSFDELRNLKLDGKTEFVKVVQLNDRTKLFLISRHQSSLEKLMNTFLPNQATN